MFVFHIFIWGKSSMFFSFIIMLFPECLHMYIYRHTHTNTHTYKHIHIHTHTYMCVLCLYKFYIYIYVCVCIYRTYIYIMPLPMLFSLPEMLVPLQFPLCTTHILLGSVLDISWHPCFLPSGFSSKSCISLLSASCCVVVIYFCFSMGL